LALEVLGLREDGYHEVATVLQTISIYDDIKISRREGTGITLSSSLPFLPLDGRNLAAKAAAAFFEAAGFSSGVEIELFKHIPVGAGMAGGSTNAAGVLIGLNELFGAGYSIDELTEIGRPLGADVAFCLRRGTYLATGIGDVLTKVTDMPPCTMVVAKPRFSISTPELYRSFDSFSPPPHPDIKALISALPIGIEQAAPYMANMLEPVAAAQIAQISEMTQDLKNAGAVTALMTGSGSAVFGIFLRSRQAMVCTETMRKKYSRCFISPAHPVRE
jgi:4-diphosphocytidyl-2-C-methyl-D-erythritol kinase